MSRALDLDDKALDETPLDDRRAPGNDELVRQCLPLVNHLVRAALSRVPTHVNRDDLVSAAMYALAAAARNFDPALNVPFASYAALRIRGAITDELRAMDWASRDSRRRCREVDDAGAQLVAQLGRTPTHAEVAHELGLSVAELSAIRADADRASVISLHALAPDDSDIGLPVREAGPEDLLLKREELGYLREAIAALPTRVRFVVEEYYLARRKMSDIAADLGVTESRVSQLRSQALTLLREVMQSAMDDAPAAVAPVRRRRGASTRVSCADASRSTLAQRLSATTVLGESRTELRRAAVAGS